MKKQGRKLLLSSVLVPELWTLHDSRYASTIASSSQPCLLAQWSIVKTKRIVARDATSAKVAVV